MWKGMRERETGAAEVCVLCWQALPNDKKVELDLLRHPPILYFIFLRNDGT